MQLRDYQVESVLNVKKSWKNGARRVMLVLPTGAGKTYTFCYITQKFKEIGKTVWILVHRHNLAVQTSQSLTDLNISHGIIGDGFTPSILEKVHVAKVGSVVNRLEKLEEPNVIIVDEAHHSTAGAWSKILKRFPKALVLGVTATPERLDGKFLGANSGGIYNDLVVGPTMRQLVVMGFLSNPIYKVFGNFDNDSVRLTSAGDFDTKEASKALDKPKILNNVVARYKQVCNNQPAICFCCNIKHAEDTAREFEAFGYKAKALVGKMNFREQQKYLNMLSTGELHVITSCEIISEGTDIPDVTAAILMRPTWSLTLYLQQVGRALRVAKDKRQKYIIDMVGNIYRHGHPLLERNWQIDGERKTPAKRKKEQDNYKIKTCSECFGVFEEAEIKRNNNFCPDCGAVFGTKQRRIDIVDGELITVEWDDLEREIIKLRMEQDEIEEKKRKKREYWKTIYSCDSINELVDFGKEKGYKYPRQWAERIWKNVQKNKQK